MNKELDELWKKTKGCHITTSDITGARDVVVDSHVKNMWDITRNGTVSFKLCGEWVTMSREDYEKYQKAKDRDRKTRTIDAKDYPTLKHGVYRIYWKNGGSSLASVGYDHSGRKWMAPCNWINMDKTYIDEHIGDIEKFKLIKENKYK